MQESCFSWTRWCWVQSFFRAFYFFVFPYPFFLIMPMSEICILFCTIITWVSLKLIRYLLIILDFVSDIVLIQILLLFLHFIRLLICDVNSLIFKVLSRWKCSPLNFMYKTIFFILLKPEKKILSSTCHVWLHIFLSLNSLQPFLWLQSLGHKCNPLAGECFSF